MSHQTQPKTQVTAPIHPSTRLGHVHYTVANLDRQVAFYQNIVGFKLHWHNGKTAALGAGGEDLLHLTEQPDARRYRGTTGLYHTAFNVPTTLQLAHLLYNISETQTPIQGLSNHGTHLAIYLPDAEGNGIELAWDFPQDQWPRTAEDALIRSRRFDTQALVRELEQSSAAWQGLDSASRVGHVHLHVADVHDTTRFYADVLGFETPDYLKDAPAQFAEQVRFFRAGGYHHHIGTNVWQGVGAPPPPLNALGLRYFTIVLPHMEALQNVVVRLEAAGITPEQTEQGIRVQDPAHNALLLTHAAR